MDFQSVQMNNGKVLDGEKIGKLVGEIISKFADEKLSCDEAKIILDRAKDAIGEFSMVQNIAEEFEQWNTNICC